MNPDYLNVPDIVFCHAAFPSMARRPRYQTPANNIEGRDYLQQRLPDQDLSLEAEAADSNLSCARGSSRRGGGLPDPRPAPPPPECFTPC